MTARQTSDFSSTSFLVHDVMEARICGTYIHRFHAEALLTSIRHLIIRTKDFQALLRQANHTKIHAEDVYLQMMHIRSSIANVTSQSHWPTRSPFSSLKEAYEKVNLPSYDGIVDLASRAVEQDGLRSMLLQRYDGVRDAAGLLVKILERYLLSHAGWRMPSEEKVNNLTRRDF